MLKLLSWLSNRDSEADFDEWEHEDKLARAKRMELLRSGEMIEDSEGERGGPTVLATHWAPRRPKATRTPPSAPGFYAQRIVGSPAWSVVEVVEGIDGGLWWASSMRDRARRVDFDGGLAYEWSNTPLAMPS